MRKISLFAVAAALIATGLGLWGGGAQQCACPLDGSGY
jgi:hypothetical protein